MVKFVAAIRVRVRPKPFSKTFSRTTLFANIGSYSEKYGAFNYSGRSHTDVSPMCG